MREADGAITLEAAVVMPFVMMLFMVFAGFLKWISLAMSVQAAASQTAEYTAVHLYPAAVAAGRIAESSYFLQMPGPAAELLDGMTDLAAEKTLETLARNHFHSRWADKRCLRVEKSVWPDLSDRSKPYLGLRLSCTFDLGIPFFDRRVVIAAEAYERVWAE